MEKKMTNLTERQKFILALVIRDYIETAQAVGSKRIVEHYGLSVSSATIRNEMVALTEMGYLRQLHTSAGRVPTEERLPLFCAPIDGPDRSPRPHKTHNYPPILSSGHGRRPLDAISSFNIG